MRAFGCAFAISLLLGAMGAALAEEHSCDDPMLIGTTISELIQRVFDTAKIDLSASTTNMPRFTSYLVMEQAIERAGVIDREKIREALFKERSSGRTATYIW